MLEDKINRFLNEKKGEHLDQVKEIILTDSEILNEIFHYNCHKMIFQISKTHPQLLYPKWDYFFDIISINW